MVEVVKRVVGDGQHNGEKRRRAENGVGSVTLIKRRIDVSRTFTGPLYNE